MARFKKIPLNKNEGKIIYNDGIVDGIVLIALNEIPGVKLYNPPSHKKMRSKSIKVTMDKDGVHVDISVQTHFSQSVADVAFKIQEAVRHNVESMTEYHIASVNVIVKGVSFEELAPPTQSEIVKEG